jgi:hypothetical protein
MPSPVDSLPPNWLAKADSLEPYAPAAAQAFRDAADGLEQALARAANELLTLDQAAERSGYSTEHLARLVRKRKLPGARGKGGRIYVWASDLPIKPAQAHTRGTDVHELASRLRRGKEGRDGL